MEVIVDRRQFVGAAALGVVGTLAARVPATAQGVTRVGAWGAAAFGLDGVTFGGNTARMVVHPGIGGTRPRLRLSNVAGTVPVAVRSVFLGRHAGGGAVVAGTNRPVTFGGTAAVTIAPGAQVLSDPVTFTVAAGTDLAVSVHVATPVADITGHRLAAQKSYVSVDGDHAAVESATPYTTEMASWYLIDELSVEVPGTGGTVVCLGDSITDGVGSVTGTNQRWPDQLATRLRAEGMPVGVLNAGISGNRVLADGASQNSQARLAHDVLTHPNVHAVVLVEGINDIATGQSASAHDLVAAYRQIRERLRLHGIRLLLGTITPWLGSANYTDAKEAVREAVNAVLRDQFTDVVDFDHALRDPAEPKRMLAAYDSGGGVHPNPAGYQAMAQAVDLTLLAPQAPALNR
jgi:lysophospholipase L1-like esterase